MAELSRRGVLGVLAACAVAGAAPARGQDGGWAGGRDGATVAWPCDVPGWDPQRRFAPDAQPLYRMVFDAPLERDGRMELGPGLVTAWRMAPDGRSLELALREGVRFHDGTEMTAEDLRWSFLERFRAAPGLDAARAWGRVVAIETPGRLRAVMRFSAPALGAPAWLGFLGSFVVPRAAMERLGPEGFEARPVGTGPYRLVEHAPGERMVLERNERHWGPPAALRRITVAVVREPWARAALVQAGRADLAVAVPVRAVARLAGKAGLQAEAVAGMRVVMLLVRGDGAFADRRVRMAAHHAIDKQALSQAFTHGASVPLSVPAVPGGAGHPDDVTVPHDPNLALQLLAAAGVSAARPARVRLAATQGLFAGDHDMARAIVAMWRRVGIEAELEVAGAARLRARARAGLLPEATLCAFDAAGGDPETGLGRLLHPRLAASPWGDAALGGWAEALFDEADEAARQEGWLALTRAAVAEGACMPLLQGVQTVVRRAGLGYRPDGGGAVLPATLAWG